MAPALPDKPEVIALNKSDTLDDELIAALSDELEAEAGARPLPLSGVTGAGVEAVLDALLPHIAAVTAAETEEEQRRLVAAVRASYAGMTRRRAKIRTLAVTGGTGFVGSHLLRLALAEGYDVRALTRGWKPPEDEIAWVDGALDRPETLVKLCAGADAVIHVAGAINAPRPRRFRGGQRRRHRRHDRRRPQGRASGASSTSPRSPRASRTCPITAGRRRSRSGWSPPPASTGRSSARRPFTAPATARRSNCSRWPGAASSPLPPKGRFSVIHVEDLCRLILALLDDSDSWAETYEPDDGREGGWQHRHFARTLGRLYGRRALTLAMPRPVLRLASRPRPPRPPRQRQADPPTGSAITATPTGW